MSAGRRAAELDPHLVERRDLAAFGAVGVPEEAVVARAGTTLEAITRYAVNGATCDQVEGVSLVGVSTGLGGARWDPRAGPP